MSHKQNYAQCIHFKLVLASSGSQAHKQTVCSWQSKTLMKCSGLFLALIRAVHYCVCVPLVAIACNSLGGILGVLHQPLCWQYVPRSEHKLEKQKPNHLFRKHWPFRRCPWKEKRQISNAHSDTLTHCRSKSNIRCITKYWRTVNSLQICYHFWRITSPLWVEWVISLIFLVLNVHSLQTLFNDWFGVHTQLGHKSHVENYPTHTVLRVCGTNWMYERMSHVGYGDTCISKRGLLLTHFHAVLHQATCCVFFFKVRIVYDMTWFEC